MSTFTPELDIATALEAAGLGVFNTTPRTIIAGPPRSQLQPGIDLVQLFVMPAGGLPPEPFNNAAVDGSMFNGEFDVLVRTTPNDYAGALALARQVRAALHLKAPGAAALANYSGCYAMSSEPLYLGPNEADQHEFKVNFTLRWKATE